MLYTVRGLVLRETPVKDSSKYINILTAERGRISVFVRAGTKGRFIATTRIFCFSEFVIFERGGKYTLNEATLVENYFGICEDYNRMTLGTYVLNTAEYVSREEQAEEELLRLALNTLWALMKFRDKDYRLIKGIYEIRLCALLGIAPNLVTCSHCAKGVGDEDVFLNVMEGTMVCHDCHDKEFKEIHIESERLVDENRTAQIVIPLSPAAVLAMQHGLYADMGKLFSFTLAKECIGGFSEACEKYFENQTEHHFTVLDMLI